VFLAHRWPWSVLPIVALGLALLSRPAAAVSLRYADGAPAPVLQAWVEASAVPTLDGIVTVHRDVPCADGSSCTTWPGDEIWLNEPAEGLRLALSHELGHRFDYLAMTAASRSSFQALVGDRRPWRTSPNSPHEKFAEAYGLCFRRGAIGGGRHLGYDLLMWPQRHRRVCGLVRWTAAAYASRQPARSAVAARPAHVAAVAAWS
jgi:hypothetical protein